MPTTHGRGFTHTVISPLRFKTGMVMFDHDFERLEANYYDEVDYQVDYVRFERVEK